MKNIEYDYEIKSFKFDLKELSDDGIFEGYAAIFDRVDSGGDAIAKGAFKKTLNDRKHFPMLWVHDIRTPIGIVKAKEDSKGLFVIGNLNLDVQKAKEIYSLMNQGAIQELSFGYDVIKADYDDLPKGAKRKLREIKLYEISPCVFAMQSDARIEAVKLLDPDEEEAIPFSEQKPSENNHICRLNDGDYSRFRSEKRKHDGKPYTVRLGIRKDDGKAEEYEYFYPIDSWSASEARSHCKEHDGAFEAAKKSIDGVLDEIFSWNKSSCPTCPVYLTPKQTDKLAKAIDVLKALLLTAEPSSDTRQGNKKPQFFSELIGRKETADKPQVHLFEGMVKPKS